MGQRESPLPFLQTVSTAYTVVWSGDHSLSEAWLGDSFLPLHSAYTHRHLDGSLDIDRVELHASVYPSDHSDGLMTGFSRIDSPL